MTWQETLIRLIQSDAEDLVELARIAGYDPKSFYQSASFRGVRISVSEIRKLGLKEENLEGAEIVDDELDPESDKAATALMLDLKASEDSSSARKIIKKLVENESFSGGAVDLFFDAVEGNDQIDRIVRDSHLYELTQIILSSPSVRFSKERKRRIRDLYHKYEAIMMPR